ncbi:cupin domain-containing protein [Bacillota bacterium Meth-B3]|nr:cupin domain-containing protein [Christensenellaceae bacterium]MEA5065698.1 cupin domain-containing protein [Eubacteriales bacterium]MEA5070250.1 cupin domain-containing protein [Christensenellaceae bacterium]
MEKFIRHLPHETVLSLADQVDYHDGQIVSKTLSQSGALSLTLFAFDQGEEISSHESDGDAMVTALDGAGEVTIAGRKYPLKAGESIVMPAKTPHAVYASERFKMFLTVVFPKKDQ